MKTSEWKRRPILVAGLLLAATLALVGCYNPEATPSHSAAYTGVPQTTPGLDPVLIPPAPPAPAANANAVTPVLRVGDQVTIDWFDTVTPIPTYRENIRDDGKLILPLQIVVQAAGRTTAQLQDEIRAAYVPKFYNHLTVSVKTEQRVYFVGGEVRVPNRQFYQEGITALRAIDTAGGFTDFANRKRIEVRRENGQIVVVDWKKAMKNPKLDPPVFPNDQIIVHKRLF